MTRPIPDRESLTVEFKSDRARLPDRELVTAVACLANTEGGELYVGVEEDGTMSGVHATHRDVSGLTALIAARPVFGDLGYGALDTAMVETAAYCPLKSLIGPATRTPVARKS